MFESLESSCQCGGHSREPHSRRVSLTEEPASRGKVEVIVLISQQNVVPLKRQGGQHWIRGVT